MQAPLTAFFAAAAPPEVVAAFLFGSHARGSAHARSDVDVAVLLDRGRLPEPTDRAAFAEQLALRLVAATHHDDMDLIVLNDVPPELAVAALDGVPLGCVDRDGLHAFNRTMRIRLADLKPFLQRTRRVKLEALVK